MFCGSCITSSSLIYSLFKYIQLVLHDDCLIAGEAVLRTLNLSILVNDKDIPSLHI